MSWVPPQHIRPNALGVVWRNAEELLCMSVTTADGTLKGYRPLGGGIDFGERAQDALKREFMEELGEHIIVGRHLGTFENIFTHDGHLGHEITFMYELCFENPAVLTKDKLFYVEPGKEDEWAEWINVKTTTLPLFPPELLDIVRGE